MIDNIRRGDKTSEKIMIVGGQSFQLRYNGLRRAYELISEDGGIMSISQKLAHGLDEEFGLHMSVADPAELPRPIMQVQFEVPNNTPPELMTEAAEYVKKFVPLMITELLALRSAEKRKADVVACNDFWNRVSDAFVKGEQFNG